MSKSCWMVTDIYYYNFSCKTCKFQTTCRNEKHLKLVNRLHKKKLDIKILPIK